MQLPREAPVMILPNAILFPHAMLPLYIFETRYRHMLTDVLDGNRLFCVAMRKPAVKSESPVKVGSIGVVRACVRRPDGTSHLVLEGLSRVTFGKAVKRRPYRVHEIDLIPRTLETSMETELLVIKLREVVAQRLEQGFHLTLAPDAPVPLPEDKAELAEVLKEGVERFARHLLQIENPEHLVDIVSCALLTNPAARQAILETADLAGRLRLLIRFLRADIASHRNIPE